MRSWRRRQAQALLAVLGQQIEELQRQAPEPIRLFFPPKWGFNDKLPGEPVLSASKPAGRGQATLF